MKDRDLLKVLFSDLMRPPICIHRPRCLFDLKKQKVIKTALINSIATSQKKLVDRYLKKKVKIR